MTKNLHRAIKYYSTCRLNPGSLKTQKTPFLIPITENLAADCIDGLSKNPPFLPYIHS